MLIYKEPSDWEGKGPWAIVPLTCKMAHKSLSTMIKNGPLKISKSLKKAENGPFGKNIFPITDLNLAESLGYYDGLFYYIATYEMCML